MERVTPPSSPRAPYKPKEASHIENNLILAYQAVKAGQADPSLLLNLILSVFPELASDVSTNPSHIPAMLQLGMVMYVDLSKTDMSQAWESLKQRADDTNVISALSSYQSMECSLAEGEALFKSKCQQDQSPSKAIDERQTTRGVVNKSVAPRSSTLSQHHHDPMVQVFITSDLLLTIKSYLAPNEEICFSSVCKMLWKPYQRHVTHVKDLVIPWHSFITDRISAPSPEELLTSTNAVTTSGCSSNALNVVAARDPEVLKKIAPNAGPYTQQLLTHGQLSLLEYLALSQFVATYTKYGAADSEAREQWLSEHIGEKECLARYLSPGHQHWSKFFTVETVDYGCWGTYKFDFEFDLEMALLLNSEAIQTYSSSDPDKFFGDIAKARPRGCYDINERRKSALNAFNNEVVRAYLDEKKTTSSYLIQTFFCEFFFKPIELVMNPNVKKYIDDGIFPKLIGKEQIFNIAALTKGGSLRKLMESGIVRKAYEQNEFSLAELKALGTGKYDENTDIRFNEIFKYERSPFVELFCEGYFTFKQLMGLTKAQAQPFMNEPWVPDQIRKKNLTVEDVIEESTTYRARSAWHSVWREDAKEDAAKKLADDGCTIS